MNTKLKTIPQLILQAQGVDLSKYNDVFLNKSVLNRMKDTYCNSELEYTNFMEKSSIESEIFLNTIQISYSEFFRNSLTYSVLEKIIIPSIAMKTATRKGKEIRIWSAACAGGQETYSLAMLIHEFSNCHEGKINFRIFATDQSEKQIQDAQMGQYTESELKYLSLKRVKQWFSKSGEKYTVKPELKENIDFSVFDLLNEQYSCPPTSIFGNFDLIVCANLLFYYKPEYQKKIIQKSSNCLISNGYLMTGETERDILIQSGFHEVFPLTAIFKI